MGRRQFTVRTLLVWMVVFALLCGALSASGVPLPLFVILFSLVAVVWLATLFCPPRVACGISVGIGTILGVPGGIAVIQPSRSPGPSLGEQVFLAVVIVMFFAAFGVSLYGESCLSTASSSGMTTVTKATQGRTAAVPTADAVGRGTLPISAGVGYA